MTDDEARGLEHAWRYFALHAEQRMTVFNFYVASAGLTLSGLAWTLADGSRKWPLGAAAGVAAAALSFVFWRLDQRGAQLVKAAEKALATMEAGLPTEAAVTACERSLRTNAGWLSFSTPWTFGRSFRLLFVTVASSGLAGAVTTMLIGTRSAPVPHRLGTIPHASATIGGAGGAPPNHLSRAASVGTALPAHAVAAPRPVAHEGGVRTEEIGPVSSVAGRGKER